MIERIKLLRNVGQFDSVSSGSQLPLSKFTLIYAGNGRGKTTLAAILRSLSDGNPLSIVQRKRLSATHPPHVVLTPTQGGDVVFENNTWSRCLPEIVVFDDLFVAENVCSGIDVDPEHRQNLHDLILGAQGVTLSNTVQAYVAQIEDHNRTLRTKADAIPASARGKLTVDDFCALPDLPDLSQEIQDAERILAAARAEDAIRTQPAFDKLSIPDFRVGAVEELLQRDLSDLDTEAALRVQSHTMHLGRDAERWIAEGLPLIAAASFGKDEELCPFCVQNLSGSSLIGLYRAYFSESYGNLKQSVEKAVTWMRTTHGGDVPAAFERSIRVAIERRQFWSRFIDVREVVIDTAAISRAWKEATEALDEVLRAKQAAPLEKLALSEETRTKLDTYRLFQSVVTSLSDALQAINADIAVLKEKTATANVVNLEASLAALKSIQERHRPEVALLCSDYLREKAAKSQTEALRDKSRIELDKYRQNVFPTYETTINAYLQRFNAGFSLKRVNSVNTRGGSACTYHMLINNVEVPVAPGTDTDPCFRTTLSAGDRNTLALAFFFTSLERDSQRSSKIVVIDDPMTSLDEHRSLTTIQEMRRLAGVVDQLIVLSHSKPFLCALWEQADKPKRTAMRIIRDGAGSTLSTWDVRADSITQHDRNHALVRGYVQTASATDERAVAAALRPILESFSRVAYPEHFPPGTLLGHFLGECRQKENTPNRILSASDADELRDLLDYANKFHHDTNAAWETATINDSELNHFCQRTLNFTKHRTLAALATTS